MNENVYRQRMAVQNIILNFIQELITNNDLSPSMVEDALNKTIVQLHPLILEEAINEQEKLHQEEIHNLMHQYEVPHGEHEISLENQEEEMENGG